MARGPLLRIVSFNDVYSLENLPRLKNLVRRYTETEPADRTIVVLAGDFVAPSLLSSLDAGRGMVECMNAVGVTHATLGNHEDDIPADALRARLRELHAVCIATNVRGFGDELVTNAIVEVGPLKVGLVGVVMDDATVYRRVPFGGVGVMPAEATALREAARLVDEEGCACVVPITHQAIADDRALAAAATHPRIFAIIGGHEHDVHLEQASGAWIVKAGSDAAHAVVTELAWDAQDLARPPVVSTRLDDTARYPEDAALRARVDALMAPVHALESAALVRLAPGQVISSVGARARQTSMGALVCTSVRDALGADACVMNGGGIRGGREYRGVITYGDVKTEVPFDNEVVVARIPGAVLADAIASSRAHAPAESGGFLQVDDRVRVDDLGRVQEIAGAPLDPTREYRVALVRDLFDGMDHIEPLVRFARAHPEKIPRPTCGREIKLVLVDAFARALWHTLGGFDAVDANKDGRVTVAEIAAAVARATGGVPSSLTAQLVMRALDADHDDAVSRDEADEPDAPRAAEGRRG